MAAGVTSPGVVDAYCDNPHCTSYRRTKSVGLPRLGQNVYLSGGLRCGDCGSPSEMRLAEPPAEPVAVPHG